MKSEEQTDRTVGTTGLSSVEIDALKGTLIIFIVIGHNVLLSKLLPEFRNQIYNFHVAGFLLLPFLFKSGGLSRRFVADRAVRYLVPFAAFYTVCSILHATMISTPTSLSTWSVDYLAGLLLGSDQAVKAGSGFALFWFLPAIFTLSVIRAWSTSSAAAQIPIMVLCVVIHLTAGAAPDWAKFYIPLGLLISGYIFPLGILLEKLWAKYIRNNIHKAGIVSAAVFGICVYLSIMLNTGINLGKIKLYGYENVTLMLLHDILILSAFATLAWCSTWIFRVRLVPLFGRYSLVIYLTHSLIYQFLLLVFRRSGVDTANLPVASAILVLTLFIALISAIVVHRWVALRIWITPRDTAQWPLTNVLNR